jgi:hypothetical protein
MSLQSLVGAGIFAMAIALGVVIALHYIPYPD